MAGKEEENYLDKLLDSVGVESMDTEEEKSILGERDDSDDDKAEIIEALTDINAPNEDFLEAVEDELENKDNLSEAPYEEKEGTAEYIKSQENEEYDMSEVAVTQEPTQETDETEKTEEAENAEKIENTESSENIESVDTPQNRESADKAESGNADEILDFSEPELSEGEIERLKDMGLDTIIDDVSSDILSVEDLFGEGATGDIIPDPLPTQAASEQNAAAADVKEENDKAADTPDVSKASNEAAGKTDNEPVEKASNDSAAQSLKSEEAATVEDVAGAADTTKKNEKTKKPKKGIGQLIKNIFFENTEEAPESSMAKKEAKKAKAEEEKNANETVKQELETGAEGAEELDENQRLIYEMYGDGSNTDETAAPKKGFFAKMKYRLQQAIKKNQEEDKLEQEAEEEEYEERKKIKAEKKESDKVKKEEAKQAKKEKQQNKAAKKPEKPKKVKKPKPEPKPGDILKIKPQAMVMFVLFVAGAIILINMLNSAVNYNTSVSTAKHNMGNGNYIEAYEALSGLKLNKDDQSLYDQASAVMYVQRQYESYKNYSSMGMHTEAINALIKGLERYNLYYDKAVEFGVVKQVDDLRAEIIKRLEEDYKISETEAQKLLDMSKENFTQYYSRIEAYGAAKK